MKNKTFVKNPIQVIGITLVVSLVLILLLLGTLKLEDRITKRMLDVSTFDVISIAQNNAKAINELLKDSNNYIEDISNKELLQQQIENNLRILITKNIEYAYVVYKDDKGTFRFLADASTSEDKALVNQKLDIDDSKWFEIYDTKKPIIINHTLLHQLSITYLVPILYDNEVELVLVIDFSIKKVEDVNKIIKLMKNGIFGIIVITFIFLIILIIQAIKYQSVKRTAYIDKLTNVHNRNYLQELEEFINLDDYILATLDIDHFKKVNDTYGHDIGDKILKEVAKTILQTIRKKDDIAIRYGGEEFIILAKVLRNDHLSALNVIERVFRSIQEKKFFINKKDFIDITVSIGVNLVPQKSKNFSEAFKFADISLYNAKNKGRNTIEIYNGKEEINNSLMSINDIKEAMDENRLICYYQAIVDNNTSEISHYEALLRIETKNGEIITPDKILPAIKGTFILRNITKVVLNICHKRLLEDDKIKINVNLNPQDIVNDSIINILKDYAATENIANRLGLEIVESEDIIICNNAKENLLMLKKLGYKLFIDDFGSGYSNFIYLAEIKTNYIKIDGAIIKRVLEDDVSFLLVKSIVAFAKESNIKVVAEYVSSKEIFEKIQSLGIEYSQGYYFYKPMPFEPSK